MKTTIGYSRLKNLWVTLFSFFFVFTWATFQIRRVEIRVMRNSNGSDTQHRNFGREEFRDRQKPTTAQKWKAIKSKQHEWFCIRVFSFRQVLSSSIHHLPLCTKLRLHILLKVEIQLDINALLSHEPLVLFSRKGHNHLEFQSTPSKKTRSNLHFVIFLHSEEIWTKSWLAVGRG